MAATMKRAHLTDQEKSLIRATFDEVGPAELLRLIGQLIANDHDDTHAGDKLRSELCKIAHKTW
jgi:hypothetical protein